MKQFRMLISFVVVPCVIAVLTPQVLAKATQGGAAPSQSGSSGRSALASQLGVFVYPKNQQDQAQQLKDENEFTAKEQSGIDPATPPPSPQEAQKAKGGGARGAAAGAAIGAIAGDAGTGAAAGAVAGTVRGRRQLRNPQPAEEGQRTGSETGPAEN